MALAAFVACAGKPFDIKTDPTREIGLPFSSEASAPGLSVQARAVTDEDFLYDQFDGNLILAGILPVELRITNTADVPLRLDRARIGLTTSIGREVRAAKPRDGYKRLVSYYGVSLYSKDGNRQARSDFESWGIDLARPLEPGQSRQGMVFFIFTRESVPRSGLILTARRLSSLDRHALIEIRLN